jgi:hypothetical protein
LTLRCADPEAHAPAPAKAGIAGCSLKAGTGTSPPCCGRGLLQVWLTPQLWIGVHGEMFVAPENSPPQFERDVVRVAAG